MILVEEKRRFLPGSGEIDIFALYKAARESTVIRRKLCGAGVQLSAELEAARMLGRFPFNPIYVIDNKLSFILLIGSTFSVNQGAFAN